MKRASWLGMLVMAAMGCDDGTSGRDPCGAIDCFPGFACEAGECVPVDGVEGFVCVLDGATRTVEDAEAGDYEIAYRGRCEDPMKCGSPRDCFAGDECHADRCIPVPSDCACAGVFAPACGIDGLTYINACEAACVEVEVAYEGDCRFCGEDLVCAPDEECIPWPFGERPTCVWVGCDDDAQCPPAQECLTDDVCRAPAAVGPCDAAFERWYYDADSGQCETFVWGGCGGNPNNFESLEACEVACPGVRVPKLSIAPRSGRCAPSDRCPQGTPGAYAPVCGVDGNTYGNPCHAEREGVEVAYDGECDIDVTCVDRACPDGWTCDFCQTPSGDRWVCLSPFSGACLSPEASED
ncbi:MAG: BPTI/Kunitz-type proteinase inhibitor domain-containing protein [Polyangiales bacterium]